MALDDFDADALGETLLMLPVDWYPSHTDLERCLIQAKDRFSGPSTLVASAIYTAMYLDKNQLQEFTVARLGDFYLNAVEYSMSCSLATLFDPTARDEFLVLPVLLEFLHHTVSVAINTNLPDVYAMCHRFFHDLVEHDSVSEEMAAVLAPIHDVIEILDQAGLPPLDGTPAQLEVRSDILDLLNASVQPFAKPYGDLPQSKQRHLTPAPVPVDNPRPAAAPAAQPLPAEAPMVTPHREPGPISHLDGSIGLDSHLDLVRIFMPRRPTCDDAQAQWTDTLDQFTGTSRELLSLWRRVHASPLEGQNHQEARLMDSVGRLMDYLFSAAQLAVLHTRLPMEQVLDNMLSFVSGALNQPPHMSIAQMRISLVSAAIIAISTQETLMKEAEALWAALGLDAEVPLLLTTLSHHAEALQDRIVKVVPPKHTFTLQ